MKHIGIGFRTGATLDSVLDAIVLAGGAGLRRLALPADKAGDPLIALIAARGLAVQVIPGDRLAGIVTPTQSPISIATYATGSVAEACALAAAGPDGRLVSRRVISGDRMATAAIAEDGSATSKKRETP